eukprot:TRINITY_DN53250_c0_g1_i1.p1 TRINITY_DN53250_c0_g1~~TRINITY_DN53250_c0_g1_i1.p1  ORF type:complete len:291 (-),score=18.83 TRINITY_DN53250_c0_g1_i1:207-1079(-)
MSLLSRYLERLGLSAPVELSNGSLEKFTQLHQQTFPFENFSIIAKEEPHLDSLAAVKKLCSNRGGICLELSSAFGWLLQQLGFHVTFIAASVVGPPMTFPDRVGAEMDHMALLVELPDTLTDADDGGSTFLVEVGYPNPPRVILPLNGVEADNYRVVQSNEPFITGDGVTLHEPFLFQRKRRKPQRTGAETGDDWMVLYAFSKKPHDVAEFNEAMNYHFGLTNELINGVRIVTPFTSRRFLAIATANGHTTTLSERNITFKDENNQFQKIKIRTQQEFSDLARKHAGVVV